MENTLKKLAVDIESLLDELERESSSQEQAAMDAASPLFTDPTHDSAALHHNQMGQTQNAEDSASELILEDEAEDEDKKSEGDHPEGEIILFDDPEEAIDAFNDIVSEDDEFDLGEDLDDPLDALEDLDLPDMLPGAQQIYIKPKEESRETTWEDDSDHAKFLSYLVKKLKSIPPHSGQTTVGCEKAISYLRKLDSEISKAIRSDEKNVIDESKAEEIRDKIHGYIDQLEEAYEELMGTKGRRKKKASVAIGKEIIARARNGSQEYYIEVERDNELTLLPVTLASAPITKEAHKLHSTVDPFLDGITRLLMRAHITQGKNLHAVYSQLNDQYNFTPREELVINELLLQKGMNLNVDLGRINEKEHNLFDGKNIEFSTEYFA